MKKKFDCVEMKHKNAEKLVAKASGFSKQEELEYWHESTEKLKNAKKSLKKQAYKSAQDKKRNYGARS
jgi:hypothetical protein